MRTSSLINGLLCNARETVEKETPAALAMSLIETRGSSGMAKESFYLTQPVLIFLPRILPISLQSYRTQIVAVALGALFR
ncbi:MAG: hypothetical protein WHV66_08810, partial [Anaerolineales bacterium]